MVSWLLARGRADAKEWIRGLAAALGEICGLARGIPSIRFVTNPSADQDEDFRISLVYPVHINFGDLFPVEWQLDCFASPGIHRKVF